jgi:hypothetical protein
VAPDAVRLALQDLGRAHLLTTPVEPAGLTRRELMRRLGTAAAVALPLVTSVVAPTAAQAQSCVGPGAACTSSAECCGGGCAPPTLCVCAETVDVCEVAT